MTPPLILTLKLDATSFARFDALRQAHFPPARNFLPAHITLFHALPGEEEDTVRAVLGEVAAHQPPLPLRFERIRFLGRGVAFEVESAPLLAVRAMLAGRFSPWLTPQDRQRYKPHLTVQNKADPALARKLAGTLSADWAPVSGWGEGIQLWRYLGGPWERLAEFPFNGSGDSKGCP